MHRLQKKGQNWVSKPVFPKISLIVATYNEAVTIKEKFRNILEQDFPKEKLEIIFIDSGSTDDTPILIDKFARDNPSLNVVLIREPERLGKSHAVNIAYAKATGEIKIISDADAILEKSALSRIVSNFADPKVGAACGRQILLNPNQSSSTILEKQYRGVYEILRKGESILDSTPIFHGELSAYRSDLIEILPENRNADDSQLANVIRQKGYRAVYDSEAVFYEYAPPDSNSRMIQKVRRGQGLIRLFWSLRKSFFRRNFGAYGLLILPVEFMLHCIFPALFIASLPLFLLTLTFYNPYLSLFFISLFLLLLVLAKLPRTGLLTKAKSISFLMTSFLSSQIILFYALLLWKSGRSLHKWKKVEGVRDSKQWNKTNT